MRTGEREGEEGRKEKKEWKEWKSGKRERKKEGRKGGSQASNGRNLYINKGHSEGFWSSVFPLLIPQIRLSKLSISQKSRLLAIYNLLWINLIRLGFCLEPAKISQYEENGVWMKSGTDNRAWFWSMELLFQEEWMQGLSEWGELGAARGQREGPGCPRAD